MLVHVHEFSQPSPGASEADRNNRYAIARGEAMECGAILDVVRRLDVISDAELTEAKQLLVRIVGMLSKLCR